MNNASSKPFGSLNLSGMPNMAGTLQGWLQSLTFGLVTKTVENYEVKEVYKPIPFRGVWQPLEARKLFLKPEGQRSWTWIQCHSTSDLSLKNDDIIQFQGIQYRVMAQWGYSLNGFFEYHLVQDYIGSGPTEELQTP